MSETYYVGVITRDGDFGNARVELPNLRSVPLNPCLKLRNHSPTGFAWGYGGSGPAQLALAILMHALGDADRALRLYQDFKWAVIAKLEQRAPWRLSKSDVLAAVAAIEARHTPQEAQQ